MTSFDPSETDYGYPLYTYGQYYGGYPLYTHPPTLASRSVVESVPLSVTPGTTPGPRAVASVSITKVNSAMLFKALNSTPYC